MKIDFLYQQRLEVFLMNALGLERHARTGHVQQKLLRHFGFDALRGQER